MRGIVEGQEDSQGVQEIYQGSERDSQGGQEISREPEACLGVGSNPGESEVDSGRHLGESEGWWREDA